ncbi:beta-ribofuranosylaminobenzene 5'-phosphate synthase family protein [Vulcanisaeta sp. JCM 14467]
MEVVVEASARLHLGFYNFLEDNIAYGSIGVSIEVPKISITVSILKDSQLIIVNKTDIEVNDIIDNVIKKVRDSVNKELPGLKINITEAIPRHVGLGSTTQMSLAIGAAIMRLLNKQIKIRELAVILGRGRDSGIGIASFERGGFIVDSGRRLPLNSTRVELPKSINDLPYPIFRVKVPNDWYFLVFIPKQRIGLDELAERKAMDVPSSLPKELKYELYKLLLLYLIPSITMNDIKTFGNALTKIQALVGQYFSKYQGGIYCCDETEFVIKSLLRHGAYGAGQSSWGPTAYGIIKGQRQAMKVLSNVRKDIEKKGYDMLYFVTKARNRGAIIQYSN